MILNGPIGEFLLALAALLGGAFLIGCGVNVCWLRWGPKEVGGEPVAKQPRASCPNDPAIHKVIVFVKAPIPGKVKTRLCPLLTPEQAASLYRGFARDSLALAREVAGPSVAVAYDACAPYDDPGWLEADQRQEHFQQEGDDLGARLTNAFDRAFATGARKVVIIGSDAPHLEPAEITRALDGLEHKDMMLGPAVDGGYYLIALRKPTPGLFRGVHWSTSTVFTETLVRANLKGLTVGLLDINFDVDTPEDLALLRRTVERLPRGRLAHTRQVLESLVLAS